MSIAMNFHYFCNVQKDYTNLEAVFELSPMLHYEKINNKNNITLDSSTNSQSSLHKTVIILKQTNLFQHSQMKGQMKC